MPGHGCAKLPESAEDGDAGARLAELPGDDGTPGRGRAEPPERAEDEDAGRGHAELPERRCTYDGPSGAAARSCCRAPGGVGRAAVRSCLQGAEMRTLGRCVHGDAGYGDACRAELLARRCFRVDVDHELQKIRIGRGERIM
jgi:hypothetical protein